MRAEPVGRSDAYPPDDTPEEPPHRAPAPIHMPTTALGYLHAATQPAPSGMISSEVVSRFGENSGMPIVKRNRCVRSNSRYSPSIT